MLVNDRTTREKRRCRCCGWLYKLPGECLVITATFLHILLTAVELLIHLDVIADSADTEPVVTTPAAVATSTQGQGSTSGPHDPGGSDCDLQLPDSLELTVQIVRYTTLVISAFFFIEIIGRLTYAKKRFFKDGWQIFDTFVVLISLGVEIGLFLLHDDLLCYSVATQAAGFVVILRLWRIPRTCDVRKKEYKGRLQDQIHYLTQTKVETEQHCKRLETIYHNQSKELQNLRQILKSSNIHIDDEVNIPNGNNKGISKAANEVFRAEDIADSMKPSSDLERTDSDNNSKGKDSGIEVKDSFRSDIDVNEQDTVSNNARKSVKTRVIAAQIANDEVFDSDGSEHPVDPTAHVQEVEVQIEEVSHQRQLPSISTEELDEPVQMRPKPERKSSFEGTYFVNRAYDEDEVGGDDLNESRTYKSAEGIPMTEL